MNPFSRIREIGDVYIPTEFRDTAKDASMKLFSEGELEHLSRIFEHIRRGGIAVLSGEWDKILEVSNYVERKKSELVPPRQEERKKNRQETKRRRGKPSSRGILRLMVVAGESGCSDVQPSIKIPYLLRFLSGNEIGTSILLELVGDNAGSNEGRPFLLPVSIIQEIRTTLSNSYFIPLLGEEIVASRNVFPPNSQETIALFSEGLKYVGERLHSELNVLDMGCGSGCLALLAAQVFEGRNLAIAATDHLPEALATTNINIRKFIQSQKIASDVIEVTPGGDLFEPVIDRRFDVIIFNAPWVVSPARNRAETAIHDQNQNTVRRFFSQAREHSNDGGYILLGYSDNSGQKAIEKLEGIIRNAGFEIVHLLKERVQTRRAKRKWETIFVYVCSLRKKTHTGADR